MLSVHYDAIEPPDVVLSVSQAGRAPQQTHPKDLLPLNIGRDIRARERIALLLWVRGSEPLHTLRAGAPDLWAHRTLVARFASAADVHTRLGDEFTTGPATQGAAARSPLRHHSSRWDHASSWLTPQQQISELHTEGLHLAQAGQLGALSRTTAEQRRIYEEHQELRELEQPTIQLTINELELAYQQERPDELDRRLMTAKALMHEKHWPSLAMTIASYEGTVAKNQGRFDDALRAYDEHVRLAATRSESDLLFDPNAPLLNRAALHLQLGDPVQATADMKPIGTTLEDPLLGPVVWHQDQSVVEHHRASCATALGHPEDALRWTHIALKRREALQGWALVCVCLPLLRELTLDQGLAGLFQAEAIALLGRLRHADVPLVYARIQAEIARLALATGNRELLRAHAHECLTLVAPDTSEISFAAMLLERSSLARLVYQQWSDELQPHEYLARLDAILASNIDEDLDDRLRLERAHWHLLCHQPHAASSLAISRLPFRRKRRGPSFVAETCLVAAHGYRDLRAFEQATECLTEARTVLTQTREQARPFDSWRDVMLETSRLAIAKGEPDAAWQAIDDALAFANQRRLKVERMRLLLEQARLELDSPRGQDAAVQSLQIASELGYLRDEGQIRLVLAQQAERSGDLDRARSELQDARWLLERLGPPKYREQAEAYARRLRPTHEQ
ncbi:MAG: hypothetical protein AAGF11_46520 [Myxococcota bacterium]